MVNSIFRAYDIRGKYPQEIDEETAEVVAAKTGNYLKSPGKKGKIVVGMDVRQSSPSLYRAVILGLKKAGLKDNEIIRAGVITTPMLYFLCAHFKADGGIMITSSHSPKDTNGLKIVGKKVAFLSGEDVFKIISRK